MLTGLYLSLPTRQIITISNGEKSSRWQAEMQPAQHRCVQAKFCLLFLTITLARVGPGMPVAITEDYPADRSILREKRFESSAPFTRVRPRPRPRPTGGSEQNETHHVIEPK